MILGHVFLQPSSCCSKLFPLPFPVSLPAKSNGNKILHQLGISKLHWLDIFHQQYQTLQKVTNHIFPPPLSSPQDDEHVGDLIAWPKSHIVVSSFPVAFEDANSEHTNHLPHRCPPGTCAVFWRLTTYVWLLNFKIPAHSELQLQDLFEAVGFCMCFWPY